MSLSKLSDVQSLDVIATGVPSLSQHNLHVVKGPLVSARSIVHGLPPSQLQTVNTRLLRQTVRYPPGLSEVKWVVDIDGGPGDSIIR